MLEDFSDIFNRRKGGMFSALISGCTGPDICPHSSFSGVQLSASCSETFRWSLKWMMIYLSYFQVSS